MRNRWAFMAVCGVLGFGLAGTTVVARADDDHPTMHQRKVNQQKRIGEGVENGSLTAGETAHLERQESSLNKEVRVERKTNGGSLTNKEKRQVNRQQNRLSREIYRDKHN